jgi:hypothetical protein
MGEAARRWAGVSWAVIVVSTGPVACRRTPVPYEGAVADAVSSTDGSLAPAAAATTSQVEELRALGYLAYADQLADPELVGVVRHDAARAQPGYNLFASRMRCRATLIDNAGTIVHTWQVPACRGWDHVELLPDGDLLASIIPAARPNPDRTRHSTEEHALLRMTWDGRVRWQQPLWAHHDAIALPDGRLVAITTAERLLPAFNRRSSVLDDQITLLDAEGRVSSSLSLFDTLSDNDVGFALERVRGNTRNRRTVIDLFHTNAVKWMNDPRLARRDPLYAAGNVLVCMRHQDSVAVIDFAAARLLWAWGRGILSGPHDATVLANGHFLVFDNGLDRGQSRVIELDPLERRIVWEYPAAATDLTFYTRSHGAAQRLANGNTLIVDSDSAHAFEVSPAGDVVWEFWGPIDAGSDRRATINRLRRYPAAQIEPLLRR